MKDLSREELLEQDISTLEQELALLETQVREAREETNKQAIARSERKEKIDQEIARLEWLIARKDDEFDKEQGKRIKRTFFVLCGALFLHLVFESEINISDISAKGILTLLESLGLLTVGVAFGAGFIMFICFGVMFYITNGAMIRAETIAELKGRINALKSSKYDKE